MRHVPSSLVFASLSFVLAAPAAAQQSLDATTTSISYDFSGFLGEGLAAMPDPGQLDSDEWAVIGMSDGDTAFGGDHTAADFTRGVSTGAITTGGLWAFDVDNIPVATDYALGAQSTDADFTPGAFRLRIRNMTGRTLRAITISFDFLHRNDQGRSTRLEVAVIRDSDGMSIAVPALLSDTPEAAAVGAVIWTRAARTATVDLDAIGIADGDTFVVSFGFADLAGSGSRDEVAIDDVGVSIPDCGNATVDAGEACDDGDVSTETSCPYGMATCTACNATCTMSLSLTGAACGDGSVDAADGEACDDGNTVEEAACPYGTATCMGCSADCTAITSLTGGVCGDGTVDAGDETCDDGNTTTETACAYGTMTCSGCDATCATALSLTGAFCGDGTVDAADGEECDDGGTTPGDGCTATCTMEIDGGTMGSDAGVDTDGGTIDTDGGVIDADGGVVDVDGGATDDAAIEDDAGASDVDAAGADAGAGGADAGTPPAESGGCSCRATGAGGSRAGLAMVLAALVGLVIARRRRR